MSFIYSLCSSSSGNATYVGDKNSGILIDAGLPLRTFKRALSFGGIDITAVKAIFITHEHSDHIKGLTAIGNATGVPIYAYKNTLKCLIHNGNLPQNATVHDVSDGTAYIHNMSVTAFKTPHDSLSSVGYKIMLEDGKKICVCTDLGYITDEVYDNLVQSNAVLIESNYDERMLTTGPYPAFLKKRIASNNGHLSNADCADTLINLFNDGTTKFILGHLSENNNRPELAYKAAIDGLIKTGAVLERDFSLSIARKQTIGEMVTI